MQEFVCFHDQDTACSTLEQLMWRDGPGCPHCGETHRLGRLNGLSTTVGTWKCYQCRRPFSVRSNSFFHNSHVQLHVWLQAIFLVVGSRQRITAQKMQTTLGVSLRTAWQMKQKIVARLSGLDVAGEDSVAIARISQICRSTPNIANRPPMSRLDANRLQRFLETSQGYLSEETELRFFIALQMILTPERAAQETLEEDQEERVSRNRAHAGAAFHASP